MEQVGGDHYKSEYQHWDWAVDAGIGPLEYGATRYICRHWKKNGVEDIKKAKHFVLKIRELFENKRYTKYMRRIRLKPLLLLMEDFVECNAIPYQEARACEILASWENIDDLMYACSILDQLIKTSEMAAGALAPAQATTPAQPPLKDVQTPAAGGTVGIATGDTIILHGQSDICVICGAEVTEHHVCGEPNE